MMPPLETKKNTDKEVHVPPTTTVLSLLFTRKALVDDDQGVVEDIFLVFTRNETTNRFNFPPGYLSAPCWEKVTKNETLLAQEQRNDHQDSSQFR
jgi:hypothetical protein